MGAPIRNFENNGYSPAEEEWMQNHVGQYNPYNMPVYHEVQQPELDDRPFYSGLSDALYSGWNNFMNYVGYPFFDATRETANSFGRAYDDVENVYSLRPFSGRQK